MYLGYENRQLVMTDQKQTNPAATSLLAIHGGDVYSSFYSMIETGPGDGDDFQDGTGDIRFGAKAVKLFWGECRNNPSLRYEIPGDNQSRFMRVTDNLIDIGETYNMGLPTTYGYNRDFTKVNDINSVTGYNTFNESTTYFPNTIVYSRQQATEENDISWKEFPANNRYVMPRNRGQLTNLQGIGNEDLLIHHTNTLYRTKTNRSVKISEK